MKILLATHNEHKIKESTAIFNELREGVKIKSLAEINILDEVEESASTLRGNAVLKAEAIYEKLKDDNEFDYIISEDFGFFVEAFPEVAGVHAKRWHKGTDEDRGNAVIDLFKESGEKNRNAKYMSVFIAINKIGKQFLSSGILKGTIGDALKGDGGFAYDKILKMPDGRHLGEYTFEEKQEISTRKSAIRNMLKMIK